MLRLIVADDTGRIIEAVTGMVEGVSDYRPLWEAIRRPWETRARAMYRTQGRHTGVMWPGYQETGERKWYVWKKAGILKIPIRRPGDLNDLILDWQETRRLYPALTNTRDANAVWIAKASALLVGTKVPYHPRHEYGIGRAPADWGGHQIPERPSLRLGRPFTREIQRAVSDFAGRAVQRTGRAGFTSAQVLAMMGRAA
jgi:hypothetical protein